MTRREWLLTAAFIITLALIGGKYHRPNPPSVAPDSTGLHVYLSHGGRLVYLCQSGKPIQQVINCDNGESVLLTANLANELVLSTLRIEEGAK